MTTQTLTITEFLLARIAEDEAEARRYEERRDYEHWHFDLAARFNGARVLAECEAKRRIVELHMSAPDGYKAMLTEAVCALASVYADHPAYRQEWKP